MRLTAPGRPDGCGGHGTICDASILIVASRVRSPKVHGRGVLVAHAGVAICSVRVWRHLRREKRHFGHATRFTDLDRIKPSTGSHPSGGHALQVRQGEIAPTVASIKRPE